MAHCFIFGNRRFGNKGEESMHDWAFLPRVSCLAVKREERGPASIRIFTKKAWPATFAK